MWRLDNPFEYQRLIGHFFYLINTYVNIFFVVQQLSQHVFQPRQPHIQVAYHIFRYFKGSPYIGQFVSSQTNVRIEAFLDFDWDYCLDSRSSITVYCIFLGCIGFFQV